MEMWNNENVNRRIEVVVMFQSVIKVALCAVMCQVPSASSTDSQVINLANGLNAIVVHAVVDDIHPSVVEQEGEHLIRVKGGEIRTHVFTVVMSRPDNQLMRDIAWTYVESYPTSVYRIRGRLSPSIIDVASIDEGFLVFYIADSKHHVSFVEYKAETEEVWRTEATYELDASTITSMGDADLIEGRIVQLDDKTFVHLTNPAMPGGKHLVCQADRAGVAEVTDRAVRDKVINAE